MYRWLTAKCIPSLGAVRGERAFPDRAETLRRESQSLAVPAGDKGRKKVGSGLALLQEITGRYCF